MIRCPITTPFGSVETNPCRMMTPTDSEGNVPAAILAAASIAGVDEIYKVGGAHGVAALAFFTPAILAGRTSIKTVLG
jgi:histidinol dehydrogenase